MKKKKRIKTYQECQTMSVEEWKMNILADRIIEFLDKALNNLEIRITISKKDEKET
jgi:hypothetical protein